MYAWVAYPFTLFTLNSNTNDALVSALLVCSLLAIGSPPARGALAAAAGLTKFAPFALAPLLWRGTGRRPGVRPTAVYTLAFAATVLVAMLPVPLAAPQAPVFQQVLDHCLRRCRRRLDDQPGGSGK